MCRRGFSDVQTYHRDVQDDALRSYVIFMPMLDVDDEASVAERVAEFADDRLTYFWDPQRLTGAAWQSTLDLDDLAWDVYFLYDADTRWEDEPDRPEFAMTGHHAVAGKLLLLKIEQFAEKTRELLPSAAR